MSSDKFCSKPYAETPQDDEEQESEVMETRKGKENEDEGKSAMKNIPELAEQEVQAAIDSLKKKKGKAGDRNGIKAVDIKTFDEETERLIVEIFNEVLRQEDITLEAWRRIRIKSDLRKGDFERADNYRPICTLPTLYKLLSTLLYNRLYTKLDKRQPPDHGGFRRSYQTLDDLATYRLLEQGCREWGVKLWIATVDFAKAFDTIRHAALWKALARFEVETPYMSSCRGYTLNNKPRS